MAHAPRLSSVVPYLWCHTCALDTSDHAMHDMHACGEAKLKCADRGHGTCAWLSRLGSYTARVLHGMQLCTHPSALALHHHLRLLWTFRNNAQLPAPGLPYQGTWEDPNCEVRCGGGVRWDGRG